MGSHGNWFDQLREFASDLPDSMVRDSTTIGEKKHTSPDLRRGETIRCPLDERMEHTLGIELIPNDRIGELGQGFAVERVVIRKKAHVVERES